jgi:IS4 transposase
VLRIFTNDLEASPQEIADLYRRRWTIELFFRWIKQTLKIYHFFGTSETAVRIQITVALIGFLLLRLAHDANKIIKSPLAFARLIKTNLMQRRVIAELLTPPQPPPPDQPSFAFASASTRAANKSRILRAATWKEHYA